MRIIKTCLLTALLAGLSTASAQAQFWGGTTVVTRGPGVMMGGPGVVMGGPGVVMAPSYGPVVANPYMMNSPVIVRRSAVITSPTIMTAPAVVAAPGPMYMSSGVRVVRPGFRPGWGWGPRPWGGRRW